MNMTEKDYYAVFQDKKDFDKFFDKIHDAGYKLGFKDGLTRGLAYFLVAIDDNFSDDIFNAANYEAKQIRMARWQKDKAYYEDVKKTAVSEYLRKIEAEEESSKG